jgi:AcrR family transcriptional regulator
MARQVRSIATRQKILDAAIDVFSEVGYAAAGWNMIIKRAGMTKGALYHHFDSKEALASAIIEEGSEILLDAFRNVCGSSSPALENMIHGTFTIANVLSSDKMAQTAEQLTAALSGLNEAAARFCANLVELMATQAQRASAEGDLRQDLDSVAISESIVGAILGARLLTNAISAEGPAGNTVDLVGPTSRIWEFLLPGIVADTSFPYFRQFLAREALRHGWPAASPPGGDVSEPEAT